MPYLIRVFNQRPITKIVSEDIITAITTSNFHTLCEQYQLEPRLIDPALANLEIIPAPTPQSLLFLLRYRQENQCPIRIYQWDMGSQAGAERVNAALEMAEVAAFKGKLAKTSYIIAVELLQSQLQDMGLLLGYELARWAAEQGKGLIYGLDGVWYRLNRHQAFVPLPTN